MTDFIHRNVTFYTVEVLKARRMGDLKSFKIQQIIVYMAVITDVQIQEFIAEKKTLPVNFTPSFRTRGGSNCFECEVNGEGGNVFVIKIRQSKFNPFDFSVIFGVKLGGNDIFRIRRYNGNSHNHTNKLEKQNIDGFHIHTATERYQKVGFQEEGFAVKSVKYQDLQSALKLMCSENNFQISVPEGQARLK